MFWWIPISMSTTYNQCQGTNLNHSGTVLIKNFTAWGNGLGEVAVWEISDWGIVLGKLAVGKVAVG